MILSCKKRFVNDLTGKNSKNLSIVILIVIRQEVPARHNIKRTASVHSLDVPKPFWFALALDVVVHVHQVADGADIVGDVGIAVDGVLDGAACHCKVYHVHGLVVVEHGVDEAAAKASPPPTRSRILMPVPPMPITDSACFVTRMYGNIFICR